MIWVDKVPHTTIATPLIIMYQVNPVMATEEIHTGTMEWISAKTHRTMNNIM